MDLPVGAPHAASGGNANCICSYVAGIVVLATKHCCICSSSIIGRVDAILVDEDVGEIVHVCEIVHVNSSVEVFFRSSLQEILLRAVLSLALLAVMRSGSLLSMCCHWLVGIF